MAAPSIYEFCQYETGRFDGQIAGRIFPQSPWISLTPKKAWPDGLGYEIRNIYFPPRVAPSYTGWSDWNTASPSGDAGGSCVPSATKIATGSETRTWNLQRKALEGPDFCLEDLRNKYDVSMQLNKILGQLSTYAHSEWEYRYRHEYLRLCGTKVVCTSTGVTEGTGEDFDSISVSCPGSKLTQGILNKYKVKALRNGAVHSALGKMDGAPVLTLITEPETSDDLIRQNDENRADIRYAAPNMLLKSIAHDGRVYRGYIHMLDLTAMRYTCSGGAYTEIAPYTNTNIAGAMYKSDINSSWEAAPYVSSQIHDRTVFTSAIPAPRGKAGPLDFKPVNYTVGAGGSWILQNIPDRVNNPLSNMVYHYGVLASGSEPMNPERGYAFVHLRCDPALQLVTACNTS